MKEKYIINCTHNGYIDWKYTTTIDAVKLTYLNNSWFMNFSWLLWVRLYNRMHSYCKYMNVYWKDWKFQFILTTWLILKLNNMILIWKRSFSPEILFFSYLRENYLWKHDDKGCEIDWDNKIKKFAPFFPFWCANLYTEIKWLILILFLNKFRIWHIPMNVPNSVI